MRYTEWIKKKWENNLDEAESLTFDHELNDNPALQKEWEAWMLTDRILDSLSMAEEIKQPKQEQHLLRRRIWALLATALVLGSGLVFWFAFHDNKEEVKQNIEMNKQDDKIFQTPEIAVSVVTPSDLALQEPPDQKEELFSHGLNSDTVENMSSHKNITASRSVQPVESSIVQLVAIDLDAQSEADVLLDIIEDDSKISEGTQVTWVATKEIVLKPGFHAQAGAQFNAKIDRSLD